MKKLEELEKKLKDGLEALNKQYERKAQVHPQVYTDIENRIDTMNRSGVFRPGTIDAGQARQAAYGSVNRAADWGITNQAELGSHGDAGITHSTNLSTDPTAGSAGEARRMRSAAKSEFNSEMVKFDSNGQWSLEKAKSPSDKDLEYPEAAAGKARAERQAKKDTERKAKEAQMQTEMPTRKNVPKFERPRGVIPKGEKKKVTQAEAQTKINELKQKYKGKIAFKSDNVVDLDQARKDKAWTEAQEKGKDMPLHEYVSWLKEKQAKNPELYETPKDKE